MNKNKLINKILFKGKPHLISVEQYSKETIEELFKIADIMQPIAKRKKISRILEGAILANLFFEASTRTRISFGAAFCRLGGSVCDTTGFSFSSFIKGESIYDTSRVISGYADIIVVRHPIKGSAEKFANSSTIPIINAGDGDGEHPTQALIDLYTIKKEFLRINKKIDGMHIVITGDLKNGRTVHSLVKLLSLYKNIKFTFISPIHLEMPDNIITLISKNNNIVNQINNFNEKLENIEIIYCTRIQSERFTDKSLNTQYTSEFQINKNLVNKICQPNTLIMHPLPRDSRLGSNDLSTDLNFDQRLTIFKQTDNGIPIRMAIFAIFLKIENFIKNSMKDLKWK